ncbi:putative procollagen-proline 4-dioxygenase [Helianthus annuus]|nr:putative procollagen-proline 4-dioxygenase [Helianthus annuus]
MITIRSMLRGVLHSERMNLFMAKAKLEKSMVADNESGKSIQSEVRTSSGMFLNKAQVSGSYIFLYLETSCWFEFILC